jgi:hypothetical protein
MEPERYSFLTPFALELRRALVLKALFFFPNQLPEGVRSCPKDTRDKVNSSNGCSRLPEIPRRHRRTSRRRSSLPTANSGSLRSVGSYFPGFSRENSHQGRNLWKLDGSKTVVFCGSSTYKIVMCFNFCLPFHGGLKNRITRRARLQLGCRRVRDFVPHPARLPSPRCSAAARHSRKISAPCGR